MIPRIPEIAARAPINEKNLHETKLKEDFFSLPVKER